jgi:hypothetical protein
MRVLGSAVSRADLTAGLTTLEATAPNLAWYVVATPSRGRNRTRPELFVAAVVTTWSPEKSETRARARTGTTRPVRSNLRPYVPARGAFSVIVRAVIVTLA